MIVAQRLRGADPVLINPRSRTMQYAPTGQYVQAMRAQMDTPNLEIRRLNGIGLGEVMGMPDWAPWAIGGLALGLVGGYAVYKMRKKK